VRFHPQTRGRSLRPWLTKEKVINNINLQLGLSKQEARSAVECVLDIIKDALAREEDVLISGFSKFSVRSKIPAAAAIPKPNKTSS
jgi:integration host factor subunit alpha